MRKLIILSMLAVSLWSCGSKEGTILEPDEMPMPMELAGPHFSEIAKEGLMNLTTKNIDAFIEGFSENAIYRFNNGDSISGKGAIGTYWKNRMANVINELEVSNDVWLPLKVNESDKVRTGDWVLSWFKVKATYTTGKSMTQWVHTVYHFNESGKIDQVTHFLDTAPIIAATSK